MARAINNRSIRLDGLRGIAVLLVVFYHANFSLFSNGWLGVDVFLVLSGYLIIGKIRQDIEKNTFNLKTFYIKRLKRTVPALIMMLLISIPLSFILIDHKSKLESLNISISALLMSSNMYMYAQTDYFNPSSELNSYIHLWSLSLEHQFYLLIPLLFMVLKKINKKTFLFIIFSSLICASVFYRTDFNFMFYSLPTRIWEFLVGGFLNFFNLKDTKNDKKNTKLGRFALILLPYSVILLFSKTEIFYLQLLTVSATLLILIIGDSNRILNKILCNKYFVNLGLVSYGVYLWHQPIFVLARYFDLNNLGLITYIFLIILTILIAKMSYEFYEKPIIHKKILTNINRTILYSSISTLVVMLLLIYPKMNNVTSDEIPGVKLQKNLSKNFTVIGDSHARRLVYGLSEITTGTVTDNTSNGCIPLLNVDRWDSRFTSGGCVNFVNLELEKVLTQDTDSVLILNSMGPVYLEGTAYNQIKEPLTFRSGLKNLSNPYITDRYLIYEQGLNETFAALSKLKNTKTIFLVDVPELGILSGCNRDLNTLNFGPINISYKTKIVSKCFTPREKYDQRTLRYKNLLKETISKYPQIKLLDPTDIFCDNKKCDGFDREFGYLYSDTHHLSNAGSLKVAAFLQKIILESEQNF